jgi:hypothetical protein
MNDELSEHISSNIETIKLKLPVFIYFLYSIEEDRESRIRYISGICTNVTESYIIVDNEKYNIDKIQSTPNII